MTQTIYRDGTYLAQCPSWHSEDAEWKAHFISEIIEKNSVQFSSYVDVGCGSGDIIRVLSTKYPAAVFHGYDISPIAMDMAKRHATDNVTFFEEDILTNANVKYDVASLIDVVEHIEDYMGFLRKVRSLSEWFVFHFPLDITASKVIRNTVICERANVAHLHYFMKDTTIATLLDTGFDIVDYCYTRKPSDLVKNWQYRLAWLPRTMLFRVNPDICARVFGGLALLILAKRRKEAGMAEITHD